MDLVDVLGFIFMLSTMELGRVRLSSHIRSERGIMISSSRSTPRRT